MMLTRDRKGAQKDLKGNHNYFSGILDLNQVPTVGWAQRDGLDVVSRECFWLNGGVFARAATDMTSLTNPTL